MGRPLENEALGSAESRFQNRPKGKARGIEGQSPPLDGTRPKVWGYIYSGSTKYGQYAEKQTGNWYDPGTVPCGS